MSDIVTKVNISLGDCTLEFSGSEGFVQKQIDEFKELIHGKLKLAKDGTIKNKPPVEQKDKVDGTTQDSSFDAYPNVIHYDDNEKTVNILNVCGNNNVEKTKNLAFIYLWANEKFDKNPAPTKEIQSQCLTHGCFDATNFSTILKKIDKKHVILTGKGKSQTIKLTAPGRKYAEELIKSLNLES
jgi:hypothetical protein